jgi:MFS family permease
VRSAFAEMAAPVRGVWRNRNLRRIEAAWAGSIIGDWAYATAVVVWAYDVGGARAVGVFTAVRMIGMALVTPFAASFGDRASRRVVMISADLGRAVLVAAAAAVIYTGGPPLVVFALATLAGFGGCFFRPAQAALLPSLVDRPEELTAANAAASTVESVGFFAGPALCSVILLFSTVETVFLFEVATFLWSAALVAGIRVTSAGASGGGEDAGGSADGGIAAGFITIGRDRSLRLVTLLGCLQTIVAGAFPVLVVLLAARVFRDGADGYGYLTAAFGVGAILGGLLALGRSSQHRLGSDLAIGALLWSLPLALAAWQPIVGIAFAVVVLMGFGNPIIDVAAYTLVQRVAPDHVLARVVGALEGLLIGGMALGAVLAPWLVSVVDLRGALLVVALVAGVPALLCTPACIALDGRLKPPAGLELLRATDIFAPVSPVRLDALARELERVVLPAGYRVINEGDAADRFFLIESGQVEVTQHGTPLRVEGPGDYFGEIALLRDLPRTATVTTTEDTVLLTLTRAVFLDVLAGNDDARGAADSVIRTRMAA